MAGVQPPYGSCALPTDGQISTSATLPPPGYQGPPPPRTGLPPGSPPRGVGGPRLGGATSPPRGGVQPQPGAAPPPRNAGCSHPPLGTDPSVAKWREAYYELQEERRRAEQDLTSTRQEVSDLTSEVKALHERLEKERLESQASSEQYARRMESVREDNKRLEMKLMRTQVRESAKESEAADVKREVLEKTAAIERALRELQQQQQATLSRVKSIATSMLTTCSGPPRDRNGSPTSSVVGARVEAGVVDQVGGGGGNVVLGTGNMRSSSSASSLPSRRLAVAQSAATPDRPRRLGVASADADAQRWFQSVKANLEHFGDVEVFVDSSARECACCCEPMHTDYRVRPRKCRHVFHIECLLQWWTEGTCPVCSTSFAPEGGAFVSDGQRRAVASSEPGGRRSPSKGSVASAPPRQQHPQVQQNLFPSTGSAVGGRGSGGSGAGGRSGSMSPLLSRPAGLPGPGTFGGADLVPGSSSFPTPGSHIVPTRGVSSPSL